MIDTDAIDLGFWTPFNLNGLEESCFFLRITNDSQSVIYVSYDMAHDHIFIPPSRSVALNFQTNSTPNNWVFKVKKGTQLGIRGIADPAGTVYLAGYYSKPAGRR